MRIVNLVENPDPIFPKIIVHKDLKTGQSSNPLERHFGCRKEGETGRNLE
jgi:hypothetical protein